MRCLARNRRRMWLSHPTQVELTDPATGLGTAEWVPSWSEPEEVWANCAPPTGSSGSEPFGTDLGYSMAVVMEAGAADVREGDRMWLSGERPDPSAPGAYVVSRVAPSLNFVAVGLRSEAGR